MSIDHIAECPVLSCYPDNQISCFAIQPIIHKRDQPSLIDGRADKHCASPYNDTHHVTTFITAEPSLAQSSVNALVS